ncbi:MAG: ATP-binding protein [Holosporaceae bacterium]|jgi:anti-sigma regulatory factor (Ser/Thr protein kinase)|nr:ATP-binding protein [Holosporaceae bacterium]
MLIKIKNNIKEISKVCDKVKKFCADNKIPEKKYHDIALILDEIITNVINYAYPDGKEHEFNLEINKNENHIAIKLIDSGIPFDPLIRMDPDVTSSIEERKVGGLGIFIVKQLSEIVEYSRINNRNQLSITVAIYNNKEEDHGN